MSAPTRAYFTHMNRLPFVTIIGAWLILRAERIAPGPALVWAALLALSAAYPAARLAQNHHPRAVSVLCCLGGLAVLWAFGAPPAALLLPVCGGISMAHAAPQSLTLCVFAGGVVFMESWWGLGILAAGAWLSRQHTRRTAALSWLLGLGLAWGVYVPALSFWSLAGFLNGFPRWLDV